ncbi:cysteine desulfurase [archaeon]|jgi:cysteine desulfurase|nr:cysteine desulfurase [archaeon]MBT4241524.1 cysteine desulfurase [archaeon]MBT4417605.1 cysteine desulfurase [archaeon]
MNPIYLDNAATTQVDEKVLKAMLPYFTEKYGNASSQHVMGQEAKRALEDSRSVIAKSIGAKREEIIFTAGGTEANNFCLKGCFFAEGNKGHIITTKIEHDCVLNSCKWLEKQGCEVTYLNVDEEGFVSVDELKGALRPETFLVSIIHGNNEIGTVQDLVKIGEVCKEKGIMFHTDACQSYTKVLINVDKMNLDFVTLNSHKIHGPKGVGALYIRKDSKITPLLHGGGHEFGLRSTTENISGVVGFAKAVQVAGNSDIRYMNKLRAKLIDGLLKIPNVTLNGSKGDERLCNNINVSFNDIEGEAIGGYLDAYGISSSTGSACSSNTLDVSHVLKAIGLSHEQINTSIRLSISKFNTKKEIDYVLEILPKIVEKLRKMTPIKL